MKLVCDDPWCGGQGSGCRCAYERQKRIEADNKKYNKEARAATLKKHVDAALEWEYDAGHLGSD